MKCLNETKVNALNILYVGADRGTSLHRFRALQRSGHTVQLIDPYLEVRHSRWLGSWSFKTGFLGIEGRITKHVLGVIGKSNFDVIWVDNGEAIGRRLAIALKARCKFLINHNLDNPFTRRDGYRWRLFLEALPIYDLIVTPRLSCRAVALEYGAKSAVVVGFAADELVHRHRDLTETEKVTYASEVVFVGTWMPERGPFLQRLVDRGVPLRIFGTRWEKAPEYSSLASIITSSWQDDDAYVKAISGAKIALCLLSSGNEDLHTTRSLEIPAIGTLLCAPRTSDHGSLYRDGVEACFFDDADQCADLCFALLADNVMRISIAAAGHERALRNGRFNEHCAQEILSNYLPDSDHCVQAKDMARSFVSRP